MASSGSQRLPRSVETACETLPPGWGVVTPNPEREAPAGGQWSALTGPAKFAYALVSLALTAVILTVLWRAHEDSPKVQPPPATPGYSDFSPSPNRGYQQAIQPHAICVDGTVAYSVNREGTCSHHGGVATWLR